MGSEVRGHNLVSLFHSVGLKSTVARIRVMNIFYDENRPLRIKDIYQRLKEISPPVDMVTIYRTIEILRAKNLAHRVDFGEDATYYELTVGGHNYHYITCTGCADHFRIDYCGFAEVEPQLLKKIPDFRSISSHSIQFFGLCKKCYAKKLKNISHKKSAPASARAHRASKPKR